jgi:uncharacterized protein
MAFEYDPQKSRANKIKHGIDFEESQAIWLDENRMLIPARVLDEPRFLLIGTIKGVVWSAVITRRGENTRIISVRRARKEEVKYYESEGV